MNLALIGGQISNINLLMPVATSTLIIFGSLNTTYKIYLKECRVIEDVLTWRRIIIFAILPSVYLLLLGLFMSYNTYFKNVALDRPAWVENNYDMTRNLATPIVWGLKSLWGYTTGFWVI